MLGFLSVPIAGSASTTSSTRRSFTDTWREKFAQLLPEVRDVFPSMSQLPQSTIKDETAPRAFGASAEHRVNGTSASKNTLKPKYSGGTALKKTKANRPQHKTSKPYVPLLFSKARLMKQKNKDKRLNAATLKISGPYLATPIGSGSAFKEASGHGFA